MTIFGISPIAQKVFSDSASASDSTKLTKTEIKADKQAAATYLKGHIIKFIDEHVTNFEKIKDLIDMLKSVQRIVNGSDVSENKASLKTRIIERISSVLNIEYCGSPFGSYDPGLIIHSGLISFNIADIADELADALIKVATNVDNARFLFGGLFAGTTDTMQSIIDDITDHQYKYQDKLKDMIAEDLIEKTINSPTSPNGVELPHPRYYGESRRIGRINVPKQKHGRPTLNAMVIKAIHKIWLSDGMLTKSTPQGGDTTRELTEITRTVYKTEEIENSVYKTLESDACNIVYVRDQLRETYKILYRQADNTFTESMPQGDDTPIELTDIENELQKILDSQEFRRTVLEYKKLHEDVRAKEKHLAATTEI